MKDFRADLGGPRAWPQEDEEGARAWTPRATAVGYRGAGLAQAEEVFSFLT